MFKDKKEVIFFKNRDELIKKIIFYLQNDKKRKKIAKQGCQKYHKKFSNTNVAKYILNELNLANTKIDWFI